MLLLHVRTFVEHSLSPKVNLTLDVLQRQSANIRLLMLIPLLLYNQSRLWSLPRIFYNNHKFRYLYEAKNSQALQADEVIKRSSFDSLNVII